MNLSAFKRYTQKANSRAVLAIATVCQTESVIPQM